MGWRIRIKLKHLICIVASIPLLLIFILPNAMFLYARATEGVDAETSKAYYKMYASLYPGGDKRTEALYNLAREIVPEDSLDERYKIYVGGYSSGGKMITEDMIDNAAGYYREVLDKGREDDYYVKSYGNLLKLYIMSGRFNEAQKLVDDGLYSDNHSIRLVAIKYRMLTLMISRDYEKALQAGREYIGAGYADSDMYMLMGDIYYYSGDYDDALRLYNQAREIENVKNIVYDMKYDNDASAYDRIRLIERINTKDRGEGKIQGKVIINGRPAPYVYVYLKNEKDENLNSLGDEGQCIKGMTDFNGEYEISSLPEGNFVLGAGVPSAYLENTVFMTPDEGYFHLNDGENKEYDFIFNPPMKLVKPIGNVVPRDGNVELQWEKVNGAAYYRIDLVEFTDPLHSEGNYMTFTVVDKVPDTRYTLELCKINMRLHGLSTDENGEINPQAFLGVFYPGARVPVFIEAFDDRGRRITSSAPIKLNARDMSVITIPEEGTTEGDRLLLEGRVSEAVKYFEDYLAKNPKDIHALSVLSNIYSLGTKRKFDSSSGRDNVEGQDMDKAVELTQRLYELTGDIYYRKLILERELEFDRDYDKALKGYLAIPEDALKTEDYNRIAAIYLYKEDYNESLKYYEKLYKNYNDRSYYDLNPVVLNMYLGDEESALRFLDILDLRLYRMDRNILASGIDRLKSEDRNSLDYKRFRDALKAVLLLRKTGDYRAQYENIYDSINNKLLSDILKQVGGYYNIFQ